MAGNSTLTEVLMCSDGENVCNRPVWEILIIIVNFISIILNSFHIFMLTKMKSIRGSAYYILLQNMAVIDVLYSLVIAVRMVCPIRHIIMQRQGLAAFISILDIPLFMRYMILTTSTIERMIAIRFPFRHATCIYIKRIEIWITLQWVFTVAATLARDLVFIDDICMEMSIGATNVKSVPSSIIAMSASFMPSIIIAVLMMVIGFELREMRKRSQLTEAERSVLVATRYVLIIAMIFIFCLIPLMLALIMKRIATDRTSGDDLSTFAWFTQSLYGILNTVVYGFNSKSYRSKLKAFITGHDASRIGASEFGTTDTHT